MIGIDTKTGQFFPIVAVAAALLFVCGLATAAEQKGTPEKKVAPAAAKEAKKPEQKVMATTRSAEAAEKYATCSPDYSGREIMAMEAFLSELWPGLVVKIQPILLKCDFKVNDRLLTTVAAVEAEMSEIEFANAEQEKEFLQEKGKEIAVEIVLSRQPVDRTELKKLLGELFDINLDFASSRRR
ncbi:hypothetical protein ACFL2Q_15580 [Thermodesulfobacteriota bacterium]